MLTIVSIMLFGVCCGYMLRRRRLHLVPRLITVMIWVLLFLLGLEVGANRRIVTHLTTLGLEALLITSASLAGSLLLAWALWHFGGGAKTDDRRRDAA